MADIYGMLMDGMGAAQAGANAKKKRGLAELIGQAYSAPQADRQQLLGQAVSLDPQAGFAASKGLGEMDDDKRAQVARHAQLFATLPDEQKVQAYPQLAAEVGSLTGQQLPNAYDAKFLPMIQQVASWSGGGAGDGMKSLRVGGNGNYWAIRGGEFVDTGVPADPRMKVMEGAGGIFGVNERTLQATPVQLGGGQPAPQQRAPGEVPFSIDPSLPPEVQAAIRANESQFASAPDGANIPIGAGQMGGAQLQAAPKPQSVPAGYRQNPDGSMAPIPGGPAQIAIDARADAAAARKAAEDLKASQKAQAAQQRQSEATNAATQLVSAIDSLTQHPGFADLGTAMGDIKIKTPLVRNDAKDAQASLKNVAGQVALTTMARLKALSSSGATGFGSLTAPELKLLENSIATLQSDEISNQQLAASLKVIRDSMEKITQWKPSAAQPEQQFGGFRILPD